MKKLFLVSVFVFILISVKSQENVYSLRTNNDIICFSSLYADESTNVTRFDLNMTFKEVNTLITMLVKAKKWGLINKTEHVSFSKEVWNVWLPAGYAFANFDSQNLPDWGVTFIFFTRPKHWGRIVLTSEEEVNKLIADLRGSMKIKSIDKIFN